MAAERAARWILQQQVAAGSFGSHVGGVPPASWASNHNCLHGKIALFLGRMWQETGETTYRRCALRLLEWLATLQRPDGAIDTARGSDYVFTHAHCYAVEGLLAGAVILGEEIYLENAIRGAALLANAQGRHGGLPRFMGRGATRYLRESGARFPLLRRLAPPLDVGATAQAVRIWSWLQPLRDRFTTPIERGLKWLAACQLRSVDARIDGALPAGIDPLKPWRRKELKLYPWVAIFAADASRLQSQMNVGRDLY